MDYFYYISVKDINNCGVPSIRQTRYALNHCPKEEGLKCHPFSSEIIPGYIVRTEIGKKYMWLSCGLTWEKDVLECPLITKEEVDVLMMYDDETVQCFFLQCVNGIWESACLQY